ncbi:MAG: zinc ABC transporter ATP-binding protein ZnuC [Alphaproteobacteria bacterium]|nr:zinc ABC transporter ATP-binding protein ZnuC [Alphaproteobacteria bacterium]
MAATGLSFARDGLLVLDRVDLAIHEGEIVTIIGPNGSGKTTLVRALLGLVAPDRGEIWKAAGLRVGYVPQAFEVDPNLPLTVRRFLRLGGGKRDDVQAVLEWVGAGTLADHPVQRLSGGEMRRVLLARALLRKPKLLVLDEPVQGVDIAGQAELYKLINAARRETGVAVLMISHDLRLVMAATDEVICLNHHVCCAGHPEAVSRHPEYLALFGDKADEGSFAVYTHRHDHRHDEAGNVVPFDGPEEA